MSHRPLRAFAAAQNRVYVSVYEDFIESSTQNKSAAMTIIIDENDVNVVSENSIIEIADCVYPMLEPVATTYYTENVFRGLNFLRTHGKAREVLPYFPHLDLPCLDDKSIYPYFTPYIFYINDVCVSSDQLFHYVAIDCNDKNLHHIIDHYVRIINNNIVYERRKEEHRKNLKNMIYLIHSHRNHSVQIRYVESQDDVYGGPELFISRASTSQIILTFLPQKIYERYSEESHRAATHKELSFWRKNRIAPAAPHSEGIEAVNIPIVLERLPLSVAASEVPREHRYMTALDAIASELEENPENVSNDHLSERLREFHRLYRELHRTRYYETFHQTEYIL